MSAATIVVAGLGRCGSSLTMQMLYAGGMRCAGDPPAFEDAATRASVSAAYVATHAGCAIKVLDPQRVGLPGDVRVIWLDRAEDEQARSQAKFLAALTGLQYTRAQRRQLPASLRRDTAAALCVIGNRPLLRLRFEELLAAPEASALRIGAFIGVSSFDAAVAARQVRARSPRCAPCLGIELDLLSCA